MAANNRGGDAQIGVKKYVLGEMQRQRDVSSTNLDGQEVNGDHAAAVALQRAWRKRSAYVFVKDLKQEKLCRDMREEMRAGLHVDCEACSSAGKKSADIKSRNQKKAWKDTDELLFKGMARVQMSDRGDNWNDRWQEALSLPNKTRMDITYKRRSLDAVYSDFVHTAVTYGRTIISEYFLHEYMKSVKPKRLGGLAGGKKYLWRGILFKLADGSQGPYGGSDEAAAKAAGHELRGASEYLRTGVGLCVPPMCLLDYKGFRMLAQAHLPLGETSLKMGTNDGGRTVLNDCPILNKRTEMAAKALGLRAHIVGGRQALVAYRDPETGSVYRKKRNVGGQTLHAAADVEGHEGIDSRMYLLDLARAFPPEDPDATPHLSGMLSVSAKVVVQKEGQKAKAATVTKAYATLVDYDILYQDGAMEKGVPAHLLRDLRLFIFYRLMRPEFVRDRGRTVLSKVNLPADYKFATVKVTNPMMFAIKYARSAVAAKKKKKKKKAAAAAGGKTTAAAASSSTASGQRDRYTTGGVLEDVAPCGGPAGRPNAYSRARTDLTPVSETSPPRGGGVTPADPAIGAYESFGGSGGGYSGGYGGNGGGESGGSGGLGDKDGGKANEAWKIKAMECGIEFVSTKDKYFEGFEEVEEDEEELKRRGGIGYRQFRESDPLATGGGGGGAGAVGGYDAADLTLNDDEEEEEEEEEDDEPVSVPPPDMPGEKRVFERVRMVQRGSTFGPKTGDRSHDEGEECGTSRSQADRNIWGGAAREGEEGEEEEEPTTESSSDEGDSFFGGKGEDNYTGFDTASESSSMISTGGAPVRTNTDLLLLLAQNAQMPNGGVGSGVNPASSSPANLLRHNRGGSNHGSHASKRKPAAALTAEGDYDAFSQASLNSSSSQDPGSPVMGGFRAAAAAATSSKRGVTFPDARPIGGGDGGGKAEGHRAFPPAGGGGYDQFSSKSLASNASSVMSVPAAQAAAAGDRRVREALDGRVDDGDDDDDEIIDVGGGEEAAAAETGYSAFVPSSRNGSSGPLASASTQATGGGGALGHARVEPTSSSTEGTFRGGGGGGGGHGGGPAATFPRSHAGHSRAAAAAGAFAGPSTGRSSSPPATAAQVSTNDRDNGGRRQRNVSSSSSVSKLWRTAGESQERPAAATAEISSEYGEDDNVGEGGGGGGGSGGGRGSGYDGFNPRATLGYDRFHDHDSHGELPPPRGLGEAAGYDNFLAARSDRSVDGGLASSSALGRPQPPPPPPPPPSLSPPKGWSAGAPTRAVVADEAQKNARAEAAAAAVAELPAPSENGGQRAAGDGGGGGDGGPPPLSPDALTAFSNGDPEAKARNRDVTEATQFLLTVLVPATARLLCSLPPRDLSTINLAHALHKYGVNMRHIGLLRAYVAPPAREGPLAAAAAAGVTVSARAATSKTSAGIMRDRALVEVVVRTLKLVLREFQRRWMKSEQSSSERGMHLLVTQFLNLVTGHHARSHLFWQEDVTTGVCQRFGTVALTESESAGLWTVCSERPEILLTIVKELVKVTGVRFKESVNRKLRSRKAKSVVVGFEFHLGDIRDIEAVVTPMAIYQ